MARTTRSQGNTVCGISAVRNDGYTSRLPLSTFKVPSSRPRESNSLFTQEAPEARRPSDLATPPSSRWHIRDSDRRTTLKQDLAFARQTVQQQLRSNGHLVWRTGRCSELSQTWVSEWTPQCVFPLRMFLRPLISHNLNSNAQCSKELPVTSNPSPYSSLGKLPGP